MKKLMTNSILIQVNSSSYSRGWEENYSNIIEFEGDNVCDYVIDHIIKLYDLDEWKNMDEGEKIGDVIDKVKSEKDNILSEWSVNNDDEWNYEGEEISRTFIQFFPDQDYVDMLNRHIY